MQMHSSVTNKAADLIVSASLERTFKATFKSNLRKMKTLNENTHSKERAE